MVDELVGNFSSGNSDQRLTKRYSMSCSNTQPGFRHDDDCTVFDECKYQSCKFLRMIPLSCKCAGVIQCRCITVLLLLHLVPHLETSEFWAHRHLFSFLVCNTYAVPLKHYNQDICYVLWNLRLCMDLAVPRSSAAVYLRLSLSSTFSHPLFFFRRTR